MVMYGPLRLCDNCSTTMRHEHTQQNTPLFLETPNFESLLQEYRNILDSLEPLCVAPSFPHGRYTLWFHPNETSDVNEMWRTQGIEAIARKWSQERKEPFESAEATRASAVSDRCYLIVYEFLQGKPSGPEQSNYFRTRSFSLPDNFGGELLGALEDSGIRARIFPSRDSITNIDVKELSPQGINCVARWYGPDNMYGDGVEITFAIPVVTAENREPKLNVSFLRNAQAHACLFDPEFYETGYEGHDHKVAPITEKGLRALLGTLAKVKELQPASCNEGAFASWLGNSLPQSLR